MVDIRAFFGVINFFVPFELVSAVLMVFTLENVLDRIFVQYIPSKYALPFWLTFYLLGVIVIGAANLFGSDDEELEELANYLEDL